MRKKAEDEAKRRMEEERRAFAEARKSMVSMLLIPSFSFYAKAVVGCSMN